MDAHSKGFNVKAGQLRVQIKPFQRIIYGTEREQFFFSKTIRLSQLSYHRHLLKFIQQMNVVVSAFPHLFVSQQYRYSLWFSIISMSVIHWLHTNAFPTPFLLFWTHYRNIGQRVQRPTIGSLNITQMGNNFPCLTPLRNTSRFHSFFIYWELFNEGMINGK